MISPVSNPLEQFIGQSLQTLYVTCLGQGITIVDCHLVENRAYILAENALTQPEKLLLASGQNQLAHQMRNNLEAILCHKLQSTLERQIQVSVDVVLWASDLVRDYASITVVFEQRPELP